MVRAQIGLNTDLLSWFLKTIQSVRTRTYMLVRASICAFQGLGWVTVSYAMLQYPPSHFLLGSQGIPRPDGIYNPSLDVSGLPRVVLLVGRAWNTSTWSNTGGILIWCLNHLSSIYHLKMLHFSTKSVWGSRDTWKGKLKFGWVS